VTTGAGEDRETLVAGLIDELTRARQRGLDDLDLNAPARHQYPVAAPNLEYLARRYAGDEETDRVPLIRTLLRDALDAWERDGDADDVDNAQFIRDLFFAPDGGSPGRYRPGELMKMTRQNHRLDEEAVPRRRQTAFRLFAAYLVDFVTAPHPPPEAPSSSTADRRTVFVVTGAVLLAAVGGGATVVDLLRDSPTPGGAATAPVQPVVPTGPDGRLLLFRFDDLGGGSPIIRVFPGVTDAAPDNVPNGRYNSGEEVPAICQTTGRLERSDPSVGERPRESDVWVRIVGSPGQTQYARLTYGYMAREDLEALPQCPSR
jgi:hypothetical protein